jgi:hypothetical protein
MRLLPFVALLSLVACSGSAAVDSAGDGDADTDTDSDTDTDTDADTDADPNAATVRGRITLPDGSPAGNYRVNVCRQTCVTVKSESDGSYEIVGLDAQTASFYVQAYGESDYAVPYGPIDLVAAETYTQDMELVPVAGSAALEVGRGATIGGLGVLTVTTAFETALGDPVDTVTYTNSTTSTQRTTDTINGEQVESLVYLGTFEAKGEATFQMARNMIGAGERRNVWVAELPEESAWTLAGSVVAQDDGEMMMGDVPVTHLTTLAVTRPNE